MTKVPMETSASRRIESQACYSVSILRISAELYPERCYGCKYYASNEVYKEKMTTVLGSHTNSNSIHK